MRAGGVFARLTGRTIVMWRKHAAASGEPEGARAIPGPFFAAAVTAGTESPAEKRGHSGCPTVGHVGA
jgi:hypothetical protein